MLYYKVEFKTFEAESNKDIFDAVTSLKRKVSIDDSSEILISKCFHYDKENYGETNLNDTVLRKESMTYKDIKEKCLW